MPWCGRGEPSGGEWSLAASRCRKPELLLAQSRAGHVSVVGLVSGPGQSGLGWSGRWGAGQVPGDFGHGLHQRWHVSAGRDRQGMGRRACVPC